MRRGNDAEWHSWFAWYPVRTLECIWVWGSVVRRKRVPRNYRRDAPKAHRPPSYKHTCPPWWAPTYWYRVPDDSV